jgi:PmbA protein
MKYQEFKNTVFDYASHKGLTEFELYGTEQKEFEISVSNEEIERYKDAGSRGACFKTVVKGKPGLCFTEIYDRATAFKIVDEAIENSELIDSPDVDAIYSGGGVYREFPKYEAHFEHVSVKDKIAFGKTLEKEAKTYHPSIVSTPYCIYFDSVETISIDNSFGIHLEYTREGGGGYLVAAATDGKSVKTGFDFVALDDFDPESAKSVAISAAMKAMKKLGAKSVPSGKYSVLLDYEVTGNLMALFSAMINAENVQKGLSLLADKLGRTIVSEALTVTSEPWVAHSLSNIPFDAQGVPTRTINIVEEGRLTSFLHNLKTAKKDGLPSTGNASRSGYSQSPSIAPQNLILKPGTSSFDELVSKIDKGLYITDLQGMHSGANPYSGQLSVAAEGFFIENGKIGYPVDQITFSGNLLELLVGASGVSEKTRLITPAVNFSIYCPCLLLSGADIAGKETVI